MTGFASADHAPLPAAYPISVRSIQRVLFWLVGISGAIVLIEPSPYEVAIMLAIGFFATTGLRLSPPLLVPLSLLIIVNIGYCMGASDLFDDIKVLNWILTSWYMAVAAIFFATASLDDTKARLEFLSRGYVCGAVIASLAGLAGYFSLFPGAYDLFTYAMRAKGTFKDPNVLGAFLIYPAIYCMQQVLEEKFSKAMRYGFALAIICLAIFLAFSRAAWGTLAGATLINVVLMYLSASSQRKRVRIVTLTAFAVMIVIAAVMVLLSLDSISDLFQQRASFNQSYDSGRFGRFGRHVLGFEMALDYPFGIGPLQFSTFFPEDTHNSFLNAFMSGGWVSGIFYPALIFTTVIYGFRCVFYKTPWQRLYIAIYSTYFVEFCESFIIDTDHWRHYYLLLGTVWGVAIASTKYRKAAIEAQAYDVMAIESGYPAHDDAGIYAGLRRA